MRGPHACCGVQPLSRMLQALSQASTSVMTSIGSPPDPSCPMSALCALCSHLASGVRSHENSGTWMSMVPQYTTKKC